MVVIKVFKRAYFSDLVYFASIVEGFNQVLFSSENGDTLAGALPETAVSGVGCYI